MTHGSCSENSLKINARMMINDIFSKAFRSMGNIEGYLSIGTHVKERSLI